MRKTAGTLRERVSVLSLRPTADGFSWVPSATTWAGVELTGKNCLFSKVGMGAAAAAVLLRRRDITLHNAILWRGRHLFLSSLAENDPGWMELEGAAVTVEPCICRVFAAGVGPSNRPTYRETSFSFPGVLTEKYLGYDRLEAHGARETLLVLVAPKPVVMSAGDLVELPPGSAAPGTYTVEVCHLLDPYKNEYEIREKKDV